MNKAILHREINKEIMLIRKRMKSAKYKAIRESYKEILEALWIMVNKASGKAFITKDGKIIGVIKKIV